MDNVYIDGRKAAFASLGDVLILGLGKSGRAVAQYCLDLLGTRVSSLTIAAGEHNESALAFAKDCEKTGAKVYFDRYTFDERYDLCVASPGISQFSRFYENAAEANPSSARSSSHGAKAVLIPPGSPSQGRTARPPRLP